MSLDAQHRRDFELNIVDPLNRQLGFGVVAIDAGRIHSVKFTSNRPKLGSPYLLPGLIDAHVHCESSMLPPSEFGRLALPHGTVATVSDPHEIANVLGVEGIEWMAENAALTPLKMNFGVPSCVPATSFETAGAKITAVEVEKLLSQERFRYLSEMMNFPGVINGDPAVHSILAVAKKYGKPVDGHSPLLTGDPAKIYFSHGITTDHECVSYEEAAFKLDACGMKFALIREGSAARNYEALKQLLHSHPGRTHVLHR